MVYKEYDSGIRSYGSRLLLDINIWGVANIERLQNVCKTAHTYTPIRLGLWREKVHIPESLEGERIAIPTKKNMLSTMNQDKRILLTLSGTFMFLMSVYMSLVGLIWPVASL